jgi:hypothetical protein
MSGAFTLQPKQKAFASNMSAGCGDATTRNSEWPSRYANTRKTPQERYQELNSMAGTSPLSIPTSPSYFDLLSEELDHPKTVPRRAAKSQTAGKTVRFAEQSQENRWRSTRETMKSAPPHRPMKQKNGQQQRTQPPFTGPAPPRVAQAFVTGASTLPPPPFARYLPPKHLCK